MNDITIRWITNDPLGQAQANVLAAKYNRKGVSPGDLSIGVFKAGNLVAYVRVSVPLLQSVWDEDTSEGRTFVEGTNLIKNWAVMQFGACWTAQHDDSNVKPEYMERLGFEATGWKLYKYRG